MVFGLLLSVHGRDCHAGHRNGGDNPEGLVTFTAVLAPKLTAVSLFKDPISSHSASSSSLSWGRDGEPGG